MANEKITVNPQKLIDLYSKNDEGVLMDKTQKGEIIKVLIA